MLPTAGATISVLQQNQIFLLRPPHERGWCMPSKAQHCRNSKLTSMPGKKPKAAQTCARVHLGDSLKNQQPQSAKRSVARQYPLPHPLAPSRLWWSVTEIGKWDVSLHGPSSTPGQQKSPMARCKDHVLPVTGFKQPLLLLTGKDPPTLPSI